MKKHYVVGIMQDIDILSRESHIPAHVHWVEFPGYRKDWVADPFLYQADSNGFIIFAEEWVDCKNKGRIVQIDLSPAYEFIRKTVLLELDTHLSFPNFIIESGETYVYPENYQSGSLKLYRYDKTERKLVDPVVLVSEPLLDAQIVKMNGAYFLFSVKFTANKSNIGKELVIYRSEALTGPYRLVQFERSEFSSERGAGSLFCSNDTWIRPTQSCERIYGEKVYFKKLVLEDNNFSQEIISSLLSTKDFPLGLHTYNRNNGYAVVDGRKYVFGRLPFLLKRVKDIL